jgi:hypothetical protein
MHDKNFRLTDYIKYDTQLGRDQNIEIGTTSSLGAQDNIHIMGGVTLTCFAPQKRLDQGRQQKKENLVDDDKHMTFDQKTKLRESEEAEGLLVPRSVAYVKEGDKTDGMTKAKYNKLYSSVSKMESM